jgi:Protein of unknown function (DUF1565)
MFNIKRILQGVACGLGIFLATSAFAAVQYVENYGTDSPSCSFSSPCRSISTAITNAAAGDVILVGPGMYGDINHDGVLGDPGDEAGTGGGAMINVQKRLIIISRRGVAAAVIDGAMDGSPTVADAVFIGAKGVLLEGFTITSATAVANAETAVVIDTYNDTSGTRAPVVIAGNAILGDGTSFGIKLKGGDGHVIEANQLTTLDTGVSVEMGARHVIAANVARHCRVGFDDVEVFPALGTPPGSVFAANQAYGGAGRHLDDCEYGFLEYGNFDIFKGNLVNSFQFNCGSPSAGFDVSGLFGGGNMNQIIANVASDNYIGFEFESGFGNTMIADSVLANSYAGVKIDADHALTSISRSNIFGAPNQGGNCGIDNEAGTVTATYNFWGASTGPGADPADDACNFDSNGSIITTPFATTRFP